MGIWASLANWDGWRIEQIRIRADPRCPQRTCQNWTKKAAIYRKMNMLSWKQFPLTLDWASKLPRSPFRPYKWRLIFVRVLFLGFWIVISWDLTLKRVSHLLSITDPRRFQILLVPRLGDMLLTLYKTHAAWEKHTHSTKTQGGTGH